MALRLLIDECLSPELSGVAHEHGHLATHVVHRGWGGSTDPRIFRHMMAETLTLVTNNHHDFEKLVRRSDVHPGLIVLTDNVRREHQKETLRAALVYFEDAGYADLVNRVIEVNEGLEVRAYALPPE